jgi:hypothetical protein
MKKLLTALVLTGSMLQAFAGEYKVYYGNANDYDYYSFSSGSYEINKELGRAWVNLSFSSSDPEGMGGDLKVKVPGMIYDQTTKEVVIETEAGRVICAREKKILLIKTLKETGECKFKETFSTVEVDDGFHVRKVQKRTLKLMY